MKDNFRFWERDVSCALPARVRSFNTSFSTRLVIQLNIVIWNQSFLPWPEMTCEYKT